MQVKTAALKFFSTNTFLFAAAQLFWRTNPMKTRNFFLLCGALSLLFCTGCQKQVLKENLSTPTPVAAALPFKQYLIPKGEHYANGNDFKEVDLAELKFIVRFDSSCIYQTIDPQNQWDINKLYGFADNNSFHQQYSARFGWRWSEGALRLFAYTYNNAVRDSKELAVVTIGQEVHCAIKVNGASYIFSVNEKQETMPRLSTTLTGKGYQLYPYFGGDEVAPHDVKIWIREEK